MYIIKHLESHAVDREIPSTFAQLDDDTPLQNVLTLFSTPNVSKKKLIKKRKESIYSKYKSVQDLDWASTPMKVFCKDLGIGEVSEELSQQLKEKEEARKRRKTERAQEKILVQTRETQNDVQATHSTPLPPTPPEESQVQARTPQTSSYGPRIRLNERGERVLDQDSLIIRHDALHATDNTPYTTVEESKDNQVVNARSFSKALKTPGKWSQGDTERFYQALAKFGTDFERIQVMEFPRLHRRHVKNKFHKEEKVNPERVTRALLRRGEFVGLQLDNSLVHGLPNFDANGEIIAEQPRLEHTSSLAVSVAGIPMVSSSVAT